MSDIAEALPQVGGLGRRRLPDRRPTMTETIAFARGDGQLVEYAASVGFDELGRPREVFLSGAKAGSDMAAALADTAVALSVALQHGVSVEAMARSMARLVTPGLPGEPQTAMPASIVGAALDLLARYEAEDWT